MFAIYFNSADGGRAFIAAFDDRRSAVSMARILSRQDPRDVVVIENRPVGDTALTACYRRGVLQSDEIAEDDLTRARSDGRDDGLSHYP
jgi:hypothetical protein